MNKITLKKMSLKALEILQSELQTYQLEVVATEERLSAIIINGISLRLWVFLRNKIESGRPRVTFSLKPEEAAVILKCCLAPKNRDPYTWAVLERIKNDIDQQLTSRVNPAANNARRSGGNGLPIGQERPDILHHYPDSFHGLP